MNDDEKLAPGDQVKSDRFGVGRVEFDKGPTVLARFEHGFEECAKDELEVVLTPLQAAERGRWDPPAEVVARVMAEAIRSVNDSWGVFSRSRIDLLPHQLWVCRRVLERWPARWLVADDVGLGKTVEAGLILWPLLARGQVRRLLILCPASLVEQWQSRMRTMFDVRLAPYAAELDTPRLDFFRTHDQVVASLETIRAFAPEGGETDGSKRPRKHDRSARFFEAEAWDLVIVDEAHRLNAEEKARPTMGHNLIARMDAAGLIESMVFFTGTPHRGKDYGFFSLLKLLKPAVFDPERPAAEQLPHLRQVMIRNNKGNVTDLGGRRLFRPTRVTNETYAYSPEEQAFYAMLTEFILSGKAYANTLSGFEGTAVGLVLVAMQKLASSSVAAIRRALRGRLDRIAGVRREVDQLRGRLDRYREAEGANDLDALARLEEEVSAGSDGLALMLGEEDRLRELVEAARAVRDETRIRRIIDLVETRFAGRSVLFFTQYKATQSLLLSALIGRFGAGAATFINGDGRAEGVVDPAGNETSLREPREDAARRFNAGSVRFLVSTEAAGEGIDLQGHCHTLIHVDLPWNPMRMHQRVGRLNRIGQAETVEVVILRNPDTVEGRIWDKLNAKIESIMRALGAAMDEPEDLLDLVLGTAAPSLFAGLYAEGAGIPLDSLGKWFDSKTARFGGRDAVATVRDLVGHCARFDFREFAEQLPRVDLGDLRPFLLHMLALNHRKTREDGDGPGLSFLAPESWVVGTAARRSYEGLVFDRKAAGPRELDKIIGVGHSAVDQALRQAISWPRTAALIPHDHLPRPLAICRVSDRITGTGGQVRSVVLGFDAPPGDAEPTILPDWQLLRLLNDLVPTLGPRGHPPPPDAGPIHQLVARAKAVIPDRLGRLDLPFRYPTVELMAIFWPA